FTGWSDDILAFQGVNKPGVEVLERSQRALVAIRAYLGELVVQRRREPREDLLGTLVAAEADGDHLSQEELINTSVTILVAGHETTRSLVGNGLYLLLRDRAQWQLLKDERTLLRPAIEETLRFESPVSRQGRLIKHDVVLGGQRI